MLRHLLTACLSLPSGRSRKTLATCIFLALAFRQTLFAVVPLEAEFARARSWIQSNFSHGERLPPISFLCEEIASAEIVSRLEVQRVSEAADGSARRSTAELYDRLTKLHIIADVVRYNDYPAVEWVIRFRNSADHPSPLLSNILPLDGRFSLHGERAVLHGALGGNNESTDFAPFETTLTAGGSTHFTPRGGLSSNGGSLPFFNLQQAFAKPQRSQGGVMLAIGWSGQWMADFEVGSAATQVRSGMELTRLRLLPGETIRTPRIALLFWNGTDPLRGHNLFRRFVLTHHTPRPAGEAPSVPLAAMPWFHFDYGNTATAANQSAVASLYRAKQIPVDTFWLDAGWFKAGWPKGVGNWFAKKDAFPNGLRELADRVHSLGMRFLVWFEPETVAAGTWLEEKHSEWLLGQGERRLLNLGDRRARDWLTGHISRLIETEGIDIYRQDLSLEPLQFWRDADEADRQGITEIRYVEGLYAFWDELLRRRPNLMIDNACSGGRRIDLETMTRSVPLWRSDYFGTEMEAFQVHGVGLGLYLPLSSSGVPPTPKNPAAAKPDLYIARSAMSAGAPFTWDVRRPDFDDAQARQIVAEHIRAREFYSGDLYPLTPVKPNRDDWFAYQFHRPDLERGMVLAFRRPDCVRSSIVLRLRGTKPGATYELEYSSQGVKRSAKGRDLAQGIEITISAQPGSELVFYRRIQ